jgi:PAS domain S-box-containing protein
VNPKSKPERVSLSTVKPGAVASVWSAYVLTIAIVGACVGIRYVLDPWLGNSLPLVTLFGGVAATVWLGGWRPAILATLLGYVGCSFLFIEPRGWIRLSVLADVVGLLAYLFTCALIIAFGEIARRAQAQAYEQREVSRVTLRSIGDAVISTDVNGHITYMNVVAQSLTGWTEAEALGRPLDSVFRIVNEQSRAPVENPAARALREGIVVGLANHTVLIRQDGSECPIDDSAAPIRNESGIVSGCVLVFRDVTAQRQAEREKANQFLTARLLASIVETSDDAIVSKSLDGIIQTWNAGAQRLFGYSPAQAVGRHISILIPPDRLAEEDEIIARLKAGERVDHFETERLRADGRRLLVSLTVSPIKDAENNVVGASKIVRDVTHQREAEQRERLLLAEAAAANAKFGAFFEQGALFAGLMNVTGTMVEVNRVAAEECGYTKDDIVGKPFWEGPWWAASPASVPRIEAAVAYAREGHVFRAEVPYVVANGEERVADLTIQPIKDDAGRVLALGTAAIDITDRKRAEADRQRFATLVENSPDFIGICDLQGTPLFVNRAGLSMVGLHDMAAARRTPLTAFFFPEDQPTIVNEFLPSVLESGHGEIEIRFRHFETGQALWMAYKVLTLHDASGKPVAFATISQDVTERKRLADNLRNLAWDLSEADRRKTEFLAILAHELRNPLAPISNAVRVLRLGADDPARLTTASEVLERQVGQMGRLVEDLLDMSRITRGKIELRRERVELAPIVEQAVEVVGAQYRAFHHDLRVSLPPTPICVDADPARLAQVVSNLLNNAAKFTDPGGRIGLTVDRDGEQATIRVRDNGIGIAPEHLTHVFEMFAQVDSSLERSRDGLGIGLTLVKTLVEMHGGTISVHSDGIGRGTEFEVRLPVAAEATPARAEPAAAPVPAQGSRRVLIVDDSADAAESLAMLLQFAGHHTKTAHDGLEATVVAESWRPEVVLLDIGLPRMNGYEVCRRIRQEPWGRDVFLVALTGWGQEEDRHRSEEAGFNAHMVKPPDYDELTRLIALLPSEHSNPHQTAR